MKKSSLAFLLAALLTVSVCICSTVFVSANDVENASEGLAFDTSGSTAILTGLGSCTDENLVIPSVFEGKSVTSIADQAFSSFALIKLGRNITSVIIPASVKTIGEYAFAGAQLTSVTFSEGLETIGSSAFMNCAGLTDVVLPASLQTLGESAFSDCENLDSITIPSSATEIKSGAIPEGTTIVAPAGSKAETYAKDKNTFQPLSGFSLATDAVRVTAGKTISVPLSFSGNPGFNYLKLRVSWDADLFTLTDVAASELFPTEDSFCTSKSKDTNPYVLVFAAAGDITGESGTFCTLTFTVKEGKAKADFADAKISVSVEECLNENDEAVSLDVNGGAISAMWYTPGDITDDGKISGTDLTHLLQYLAGWPNVSVVAKAADVNADGEVTGADATLLLQYLAEWDVTLGTEQTPQS